MVDDTSAERPLSFPDVSTEEATSVGENTASLHGLIPDDGGAAVTDRGFYYSRHQYGSSAGTQVSAGSIGTGSFSYILTGLSPGRAYYFVAYATNSQGTTIGREKSFTTDQPDITGQIGTLIH